MSGLLGIGGGLGIVLSGVILDNLSYHWLFWIPLIVTTIATVATIFFVPESPVRAPSRHQLARRRAALGLAHRAPARGEPGSHAGAGARRRRSGSVALAVVLAALWVRSELRSRHPLVDMRVMRLRPVWTTNLSALLLGFGMYSAFVLIPQFVQVPESTGYGYGATVTQAGLFLVPSTIAMLVFAPARRPALEHGRRRRCRSCSAPPSSRSRSSCSCCRARAGRSTSPRRCSASASGSRSPRS